MMNDNVKWITYYIQAHMHGLQGYENSMLNYQQMPNKFEIQLWAYVYMNASLFRCLFV